MLESSKIVVSTHMPKQSEPSATFNPHKKKKAGRSLDLSTSLCSGSSPLNDNEGTSASIHQGEHVDAVDPPVNPTALQLSNSYCQSPFRCQQKRRLVHRILRRTAANVICAVGLEACSTYSLLLRPTAKSPSSAGGKHGCGRLGSPYLQNDSEKYLKYSASDETQNFAEVHSSLTKYDFVPTEEMENSSDCDDWKPQMTCVFCDDEAYLKTIATPLSSYSNPILGNMSVTADDLDPEQYHPKHLDSTKIRNAEIWATNSSYYTGKQDHLFDMMASQPSSSLLLHATASHHQLNPKSSNYISYIHSSNANDKKPRKSPKLKSKSRISKGRERRYSAAELNAAIDEVEKGRVGTRKAALIYGIPRSTLRNKVGKLLTKKVSLSTSDIVCVPENMTFEATVTETDAPTERKNDLTKALRLIVSRHLSEKTLKSQSETENPQRSNIGGPRNKRGRYRKYKLGDLEEALRVIKQGEMTVHRAGHRFGIPHSTLEYKMKERNLPCANADTKAPGKETVVRSGLSSPVAIKLSGHGNAPSSTSDCDGDGENSECMTPGLPTKTADNINYSIPMWANSFFPGLTPFRNLLSYPMNSLGQGIVLGAPDCANSNEPGTLTTPLFSPELLKYTAAFAGQSSAFPLFAGDLPFSSSAPFRPWTSSENNGYFFTDGFLAAAQGNIALSGVDNESLNGSQTIGKTSTKNTTGNSVTEKQKSKKRLEQPLNLSTTSD